MQNFLNFNWSFLLLILMKNGFKLGLNLMTRGHFHQSSMHSFYARKLRAQSFCAYILGLYFTGARLLGQKLRVEHWLNWTKEARWLCK